MPDPSFEVRVDHAVHAAHPDYVALVLLASGVTNGASDPDSDAQLTAAEAHLRASGMAKATEHPHIAAWRAAFSGFGAKPSKYPSSAEALMTRVLKGQPLPRVNAWSTSTTPSASGTSCPSAARTPTSSKGRCT